MSLPGRIWQFLLGFGAFYARQHRAFTFANERDPVKESEEQSPTALWDNLLLGTLVLLLLVGCTGRR